MKKLFFSLTLMLIVMYASSQTSVVFHENFELPSLGDSVQSSSDPVGSAPWAITSFLKRSGLNADSSRVQPAASTYLTTSSFSTVGYSKVFLKFAQICKLLIADGGVIQYSTDGGSNWQLITASSYRSSGTMTLDRFSENSYSGLWVPGDTVTVPNNSWWKDEIFDLSSLISNSANVKLRFRITDAGNVGGEGRYGWLLDDIQVIASNNELAPPSITFKAPVLKDTLYVTGPLTINAWVTDSSALGPINLSYSINGGANIVVPMTNVSDSLYTYSIPAQAFNTTLCYSITASDIYNNVSYLPLSGCQQIYLMKGNSSVTVGTATTSGSNSPIYIPSSSTTYLYSYYVSLMSRDEILSGGTIESIAFNKYDTYGYNLNNANMKIYLANTTNSIAPTTYNDYINARANATKVYESNTQNLNTSAGWQTFLFNTGNSYQYAGSDNLLVFVEYYHPGNATGTVNWMYNTASGRAATFYGVSPTSTTAITTGYRANIKLNFESSTQSVDAKVFSFTTPSGTVTANTSIPVAVKLKNLGTTTLTSAKVNWSVDGVYQGFVNWSGSLAQDFVSTTPLSLGNYSFVLGPHTIKAWTELPNNVADGNAANDTISIGIYGCQNLTGVFTVGDTTANFPTFNDLFTALGNCGINGPVTFKIKSGTYNQQLTIPNIANTSAINTVTFESETGNQNDVKFIYNAAGTGDNYVVKFDGCKYVKVKNISFKANNATYGYVAVLANAASYNTIEGCKLEMLTTTTSTVAGVYNASTYNESYNTIKNNTILNGYYGMYLYGTGNTSNALKENSNVIEGNTLTGFYYYGIYTYNQDSLTIKANSVTSTSASYGYCVYSSYNSNFNILKNKIASSAAYTYALYLNYSNNVAGASLVSNNMVSQNIGTSTCYGIYLYYSNNVNLYNNSVNITGVYTSNYALYTYYGSNNNIVNNIFSNTGGGYAFYGSNTSGIATMNYNVYYKTGTNLAYWGGAKTNLAGLQAASGKDANSIEINPQFVAWNNLHINNSYLFNLAAKGTSLAQVTDDIDGDVRSAIPFIGADEFPFPQNDAGIVAISQPPSMLPSQTQDIKVTIQNLGQLPLTSANIKCLVNGVLLPMATYSNTTGLAQFGVDSLVIATAYTFPAGYSQIKVYTESPNNVSDTYNGNDTLYKSVYACTGTLSGTYTVGGTGANYPSVDAAFVSLQCGISGPVVFNINPGTYTGNYLMPNVAGLSASNTITFKSTNNDSSSVILQYNAAGTADNYLFNFNNIGNITLKGLTLKALNTTNANIITLAGTLSNISIQNCVLEGTQTTNTDDNQVLIRCSALAQISGFNLISNRLNYGRMAINFASTTASTNVVMKYNYMYNQSAKPMNLNRIAALDFGYNNLFSDATKTGNGGIFLTNMTGQWKFYNNSLINLGGIRVWEGWVNSGTGAGQEALVYNNYLYGNTTSSYVFDGGGTYTYVKFYHNTFVGNNPTGVVVNFNNYYGCNNYVTFKNNIVFSNNGTKLLHASASASSGSPICSVNFSNYSFDYNNYYTTGATLATFNGTTCANLAALKTATSQESHSVAINPIFTGATDPHITNYALKGLGTPVPEDTIDIDGQTRSLTAPDMGCDELMVYSNDASITTLASGTICPGNTNVIAKLKNFGSNAITTVNINWSVNGVVQTPVAYTGSLATLADTNILLGNYNFLSLTSYNVLIWSSNPNGTTDGYSTNDTLKLLNTYAGLAGGTYTVGDATSDFSDLTAAVNFISTNGICGPVVFNIKPGTYTGRYTIPAILGSSSINTITIKSLNNDSTSVNLTASATGTADNWIIKLNGCQYVTIKNLKFTPANSTYGNGIVIANNSKFNKIQGNYLLSGNTSGSGADLSLIRSEDVGSTDNLIVGNRTYGGSMGIYIKGVSTTSRLDRVYVAKNYIENFMQYGIRCEYANSPVIDSNTVISYLANTGTRIGVSMYYGYDSTKVTRNTIIESSCTNTQGIGYEYMTGTATAKSLIANNFISLLDGVTGTYAIRMYPNNYYAIVANNSILVNGTSNTDTRGINSASQNTNVEVYNNCVISNKYPTFYEGTSVIKSDNNNFYSTTNLYGYYVTAYVNFTTMSALAAATQKDSNSISLNPTFYSNTNLHTDLVDLYAKGKSLTQVTNDIDGQTRAAIPCIGADEFTVLPNDAKIRAVYTLGSLPKTAASPHNVKAIIKNVGSTALTNVNVTLNISGSNSFTNTKTIANMIVGRQDTVIFDPFTPVNFGANTVKVSIPADGDTTNNILYYAQNVTDTVFGIADTSKPSTFVGTAPSSGKLYAKYYVNGTKILHSISAFIGKDFTIGKQLYAIVLNSNGVAVDSSIIKTLTASDTNTWVTFNLLNPPATSTGNNYFYAGIAQIVSSSSYYPIGSQTENPVRGNAYFTSALNGSGLIERQDLGRLMINANFGDPTNKDAALINNVSPNSSCGLGTEPIKITIQNKGLDTIYGGQNMISVYYGFKVNGVLTNIVSQTVTDTILPSATKNITFNVPFNFVTNMVDSMYHLVSWVKLNNDPFATNDSLYNDILAKYTPPAPMVNSISIPYATTGSLTAVSNDTIYWYHQAVGGTKIGQGNSYTTPVLYASDTLWAEASSNFAGTTTIGTGTLVNTSTGYPSPYANFWYGTRHQFLITAAELIASGMNAGTISSLAFNVQTAVGVPLTGFTIKMGQTSTSSLSSWESNLTTVYSPASYTEVSGWNTHTFSTPFVWNGTSNLIIETCFMNSSYQNSNPLVLQSTTSYVSTLYYYTTSTSTNACTGTTTTGSYSQRPNIKLQFSKSGCTSSRSQAIVSVAPAPANEAGAMAFTNPTGPVPSNTLTQVKVMVKNFGTQPMTSVKVNWKLNSVLQTQYQWNDVANPVLPGATKELTIGSFTLPGGLDTLIAWTSDPNGGIDINPLNDTTKLYFSSCLTGTFTIGIGKDFPNFTAAVNALNGAGVCGNTVFLVDSGYYEERLFLNPIPGAGPNAKITFTSAMGDSTKVTLHYTLGTAAWAMKFIGSSYITFSKMKLSVSGSNTWGRIMELGPNSHHIEISNCILEGMQGSSSNYSLIYMNGAAINYNTIKNNVMLNGYQVIYTYGVSGNLNKGNTFNNNIIKDFTTYAIYAYYQDSITIIGNTIQNLASSASAYGIMSYYSSNNNYLKNKLLLSGTSLNYGLYIYYNNNSTYTPVGNGLVANNFISESVGTSTTYGMYLYYSNNMNIYYNSVNNTCNITSGYAFYTAGGSNNNVVNNIFSNTGGGYAYYATTPGIATSNNNVIYSTGTNYGYWGAACGNLATFQSTSGKDANSINVNPNYFSVTDLHMVNFMIDKMGAPLTQVTEDIDGDVRHLTLPDIGADEFVLPNNDAGMFAMISPVSPAATGVQNVKAVIKNWGVLNLTSAIINWSVNGVLQNPYPWSGNKVSGAIDTITVGTYNFPAGQSAMKFWTTLPNGVADQLTMNDTITANVIACSGPLSGVYSIGGSSANYASFAGALQSLQMCGVSGNVTFNVNPGYYNEQFVIGSIPGVSATSTVTFKSANNDSTSVVVGFNFTQTNNNYVIQFGAGAQYVTIKGMTIRQTNASSGRVINFTGSPSNITIANNRIEMPFNSAGTTAGVVTLSSDFGNDNKILNNNISTGYNGIVAQGSAAVPALRTLIKGNIITGFYNYGMQLTYLNSPVIDSNVVISNVSGSGTRSGIYLSNVTDSLKVTRNSIVLSNSTNTNGIQFETITGTASSKGLIGNNFVSILNGTSLTYGLRLYPAINYVVIANNSIYVDGSNATDTRGINVVAGSNIEVYNNNVVCRYFPTLYEGNLAPISASNFNNFYSLNSKYAYFNGTSILTYNSLAALDSVTHLDTNSVSYDPDFMSTTNLHVYTSAVNNLGKPLSYITTDIDGQIRNATTPDIGADEFSPLPIDLSVTAFIDPIANYSQVGVNIPIKVKIKNFGADSVSNFNVVCKVGNAAPVTFLYTPYLYSNKIDTVTFASVSTPAGAFDFKVYISLATDGNHSNDTIKKAYFGVPTKTIPYAENFDGAAEEWFQNGSTMQWQKGIPTASIINTAHSSPNVWTTVLNGNYVNNSSDTLFTPMFDNNILKADTLKFWYQIDAENNIDGGRIEYMDLTGQWLTLGTIAATDTNSINWYNGTSPMWTGTGQGWKQAKYAISKLTNLPNYLQFRYIFSSNPTNNTYNGWAIDDFELTLLPIASDAGVINIVNPVTSLLGDTVYPKVTVKNFGISTLTSIPVKYSVNGQLIATETFNTNLSPGATADYTFNQYFKVLTQPNYTLKAYTAVTGDYYTSADSTIKVINVSPAVKDMGILRILTPTDTVSSGSLITVTIRIKNYGTQAVTSVPVFYQRGTQPIVNETWTGPALNFGDSATYSFTNTFTVPLGSSFSFNAGTNLASDAYNNNNKITKSITISGTLPGNAGNITSNSTNGGDTVCFPTSGAIPVTYIYTVPNIGNATNYVWSYSGANVSFSPNDTTTTGSVSITFNTNATSGNLTVYGYNATANGNASPAFAVTIIPNCTIGIEEDLMNNFWLSQNMPNPTNGNTIIEYNLPVQGEIAFEIVNMVGQKVYNFQENKDSGKHSINLNINDLSDGIYYYSLTYKGKRLVKKMVVNK